MKESLAMIVVGAFALSAAGMPLAQKALPPTTAAAQPASMMDMKGRMGQMDEHLDTMLALHAAMTSAGTLEDGQQMMVAQRREMRGCSAGRGPMMQGVAMTGGTDGATRNQQGDSADVHTQMRAKADRYREGHR